MASRSSDQGWPGYLFSATNQYRSFFRLNAANWSDRAEEAVAVERLGATIAEEIE